MFCRNCGAPHNANYVFCSSCGKPLMPQPNPLPANPGKPLGIVGLALGGLGVVALWFFVVRLITTDNLPPFLILVGSLIFAVLGLAASIAGEVISSRKECHNSLAVAGIICSAVTIHVAFLLVIAIVLLYLFFYLLLISVLPVIMTALAEALKLSFELMGEAFSTFFEIAP